MQNINLRWKLIWLPFLIVYIVCIAGCALLHLGYIASGLDVVDEFWLNFIIPGAIAAIAVFIWIYPRLKMLRQRKTHADASFGMAIFAVLAIGAPLVFLQTYIAESSGKLVSLSDVGRMGRIEKAQYYKLDNYFVDKQHVCFKVANSVSGKYDEDLNLNIYAAMPILKFYGDLFETDSAVWLGKL